MIIVVVVGCVVIYRRVGQQEVAPYIDAVVVVVLARVAIQDDAVQRTTTLYVDAVVVVRAGVVRQVIVVRIV